MNILNQVLRSALFFILTIIGMVMAVIFMVSTAVAVAILYVVARISGRPFAVKSYWDQRRRSRTRPDFSQKETSPTPSTSNRRGKETQNVTDVEMREIP